MTNEEAQRHTEMQSEELADKPPHVVQPVESKLAQGVQRGARAVKARKENKKFVNVLVDKDLALEAQVRMQFRGKSWDVLIQELLTKWVYETPERPYR